jgi:hypothetical protein
VKSIRTKHLIMSATLAAALAVFSQPAVAQEAAAAKPLKGPLKVFILAGQSNMEGHGGIRTMDAMSNDPAATKLLGKLKQADGSWAVRDDVFVYYKRSRDVVKAPLSVGQAARLTKSGRN